MWETAAGSSSKWAGYLGTPRHLYNFLRIKSLVIDTLPSHFDTPMFWNEDDLAELRGTSVVGLFVQLLLCSIVNLI
jgi:SET domain-containing protein 6